MDLLHTGIISQAEQELPDVPVSDMDLPVAPTHELEKTSELQLYD